MDSSIEGVRGAEEIWAEITGAEIAKIAEITWAKEIGAKVMVDEIGIGVEISEVWFEELEIVKEIVMILQ